jgi:hypothetical protein
VKGKFRNALKQVRRRISDFIDKNQNTTFGKAYARFRYLLIGVIIAVSLNLPPSIYPFAVFFILFLVILLLVVALVFQKTHSSRLNIRVFFLGASLTSLGSAFLTYVSLANGSIVQIPLNAIVGIFRSILLASFFSLLERLARYLEDETQ